MGAYDYLVPGAPPRPGRYDHLIPHGGMSIGVQAAGPRAPSGTTAPSLVNQAFGPAGVRSMASGIPVLGQLANQGNAALLAAASPYVEPAMDLIPGHNPADDIRGAGNFGAR